MLSDLQNYFRSFPWKLRILWISYYYTKFITPGFSISRIPQFQNFSSLKIFDFSKRWKAWCIYFFEARDWSQVSFLALQKSPKILSGSKMHFIRMSFVLPQVRIRISNVSIAFIASYQWNERREGGRLRHFIFKRLLVRLKRSLFIMNSCWWNPRRTRSTLSVLLNFLEFTTYCYCNTFITLHVAAFFGWEQKGQTWPIMNLKCKQCVKIVKNEIHLPTFLFTFLHENSNYFVTIQFWLEILNQV